MPYPTKKLGEICDFKVVKNTTSLPYVGMEDVESNAGLFTGSKEPRKVKSATAYFDRTCVLYGKLRPYLNKVLVPDFEGHSSTEFVPLRPDPKLLTREWLASWLMSPFVVDEMSRNTTGSRMPRADLGHLRNLQIPLPPIGEQRKIVAKLEGLLGKIKEAKRLRASAQEATQNLLSAELHKIFSEGKKKGWKEKSFDDESVLKMTSGGTPSRSNTNFYKGNIPWLKSGELQDNADIKDSEEKISEEAIKKSSAKIFPRGTVLFAMYGATAGKIGILGIDASTNQAVAGMIPVVEMLNNKFLYYFLIKKREEIISQAWGGAQPNLSQTIIKRFSIPLPPLAEQKKIVARLDSLSEKICQLQEYQKSTASDLAALKQSLLRQAFEG